MSQFEFVTVAISIVMALGVSRLLDVLAPALRPSERSWIHIAWVLQKFFNHILWWWSIWLLRDSEWNLALFAFELIGPVILYLQATALATPSIEAPESWRHRFFEIRVPFFLGNITLVLLVLLAMSMFPAAQEATPLIPLLILGALSVAGLATSDARVHSVIVALALLMQLFGLGSGLFTVPAPA